MIPLINTVARRNVIHFLEFQAYKYLLHTISVEEKLG